MPFRTLARLRAPPDGFIRMRTLLAACLAPQRRFHLGMVVAGLAALAIVGTHAGLIPMGRWQVDEYRLFTRLRQFGAGALPARLLYSPRPFSELLIFLYGETVLHLHRPLVTSFLAVVWAALIASTGLAAYSVLPRSAWRLPLALAFAFALIATALTGADVTEAFYWPMAAAAYVPTLAVGLCLFFLTGQPLTRRYRAMSGVALTVAACSTEIGAAFALCFALTIAAERLLAVLQHRVRAAAALSASAWWLIPGALGLLVFLSIFQLRFHYGVSELGAADAQNTEPGMAAVFAALRDLATELVIGSNQRLGWQAAATSCARLLFTVGFAASWRLAAPNAVRLGRDRVALGVALLGAAFFSLAAAYQHYGQLCCERQQSVRQSFLALDLLVLAIAVLAAWPWAGRLARRFPAIPPLILAAGIMLPLLWRFEGLSSNYALYHWGIEARARTWASGRQPDTRGMIFYLPPDRPELAVHGTGKPQRTYGHWVDAPNLLLDMGRFFRKRSVTVCEPWQTERSWVIGGHFIPACVLPPDS